MALSYSSCKLTVAAGNHSDKHGLGYHMTILGLSAVTALAWIGVFALVILALRAAGNPKRPAKLLEADAAAYIAEVSSAGTPRQKLTALTAYSIRATELTRAPTVAGAALRRPGLASRWKDPHRVHVS